SLPHPDPQAAKYRNSIGLSLPLVTVITWLRCWAAAGHSASEHAVPATARTRKRLIDLPTLVSLSSAPMVAHRLRRREDPRRRRYCAARRCRRASAGLGDGAACHHAHQMRAVGRIGVDVAHHLVGVGGDALERLRRPALPECRFGGGMAEDAVLAGAG